MERETLYIESLLSDEEFIAEKGGAIPLKNGKHLGKTFMKFKIHGLPNGIFKLYWEGFHYNLFSIIIQGVVTLAFFILTVERGLGLLETPEELRATYAESAVYFSEVMSSVNEPSQYDARAYGSNHFY